ncbi:MAG: ClpXP protease specificity-enhancing factor [Methylococcaceae bacterium]|nr:MAG: ClpXP protease specificity-enhancing factor [Methylococcaceae bacterium]
MTSLRPYLIRAIYDWILHNNLTPYLLVNALADGVLVPQQYVQKDGSIILNLRPEAVQALLLGDHYVEFTARFGGVPQSVTVPVPAVMAIYAKENGRGMVFEAEEGDSQPPPPHEPPKDTKRPKPKKPVLTLVK